MRPIEDRYREARKRHHFGILLIECGDFLEAIGGDAEIVAKALCLTLTRMIRGENKIPMCGFPKWVQAKYVEKLRSEGYRVILVDSEDNAVQVA